MSDEAFGKYYRMEETATFFLQSAFEHARIACELEIAGTIFEEMIQRIDPPKGWAPPELPAGLPDLLATLDRGEPKVLPDKTLDQLSKAWAKAQQRARRSDRRLDRAQSIQSVEMLAHVIDLAVCVECAVNRRLYFLLQAGQLTTKEYERLMRGRLPVPARLSRVLEVEAKPTPEYFDRIAQLFQLRNKAVHYDAANAVLFQVTLNELLSIWRAVDWCLGICEGSPGSDDLRPLVAEIVQKWFAE